MSELKPCRHCNGTGMEPDKLRQECVGCQKPITVTFTSLDEIVASDGMVFCAECRPRTKGQDSNANE